jgi:predicted RNase H-like HicB family nuclease
MHLISNSLRLPPARWLWMIRHNSTIWDIVMKAEFTAIIEAAPEGGFWAICPEVPGANGQGETIEEAKNNLRQAIELILGDRKADILRGLPEDAIQDKVMVG